MLVQLRHAWEQEVIMRIVLVALALAGAMAAAPPSAEPEHEHGPPADSPRELAIEGFHTLMRALQLYIDSLPRFEMPMLTEDGDIIIRRKRPPEGPPPAPDHRRRYDLPDMTT